MSNKKTLARRELIALMAKFDLNSREVAAILGVTPTTVRKWRCDARPVPPYALPLLKLTKGKIENLPA
jgi:DNA-binding transcriptional regulator YiaG